MLSTTPLNHARLDAPIVLAHGLFGFDRIGLGRVTLAWYFRGIPESLRAAGNRVLVTRVHPTASVVFRASKLAERINAVFPEEPFHIIGHSMGGLDARALLLNPSWSRRVLSLTTIGTPHLGSALADSAQGKMQPVYRLLKAAKWDYRGFLDVTRETALAFHSRAPEPAGIPCFSIAGNPEPEEVCRPLRSLHALLERAEGPNDGLVSVKSALAFGIPLPAWPLDHLRQMNWFPPDPSEHALPSAIAVYFSVVNHLADLGFGASTDEHNENLATGLSHV